MSKFHTDLVAALNELKNPSLDGTANYGKYTTLPTCLNAAKDVLAGHSLAVIQLTHSDPDRLVTQIVHASGEFIEDGGVPLLCENKANPQKMGSAITYARRYGLCAMLGISGEEDDDGQRATPKTQLPPPKPPQREGHSKSHSKPSEGRVVDNIADTMDPIPKNNSWVDEQIAGFAKHRHIVEHDNWGAANDETIQGLSDADYTRILEAFKARKKELLNE